MYGEMMGYVCVSIVGSCKRTCNQHITYQSCMGVASSCGGVLYIHIEWQNVAFIVSLCQGRAMSLLPPAIIMHTHTCKSTHTLYPIPCISKHIKHACSDAHITALNSNMLAPSDSTDINMFWLAGSQGCTRPAPSLTHIYTAKNKKTRRSWLHLSQFSQVWYWL